MVLRPVQPMVPYSVRRALSRPEYPEAARPGVLVDPYRGRPARPSAAAAPKVRALQATEEAEAMVAPRLAQAERLAPAALQVAEAAAVQEAQQVLGVAAAQPQAAPEVWDVAVAPQPAAEEPAGAVRPLEAAAVQDVAAVQRRVAGPVSVAVRLRGAGVLDAAVLRRAAPDAQGGLLLAAAWAALPSIRCRGDQPAPSARARSAHARRALRTARP
jgi:hypothetical protein